MDKVVFYTVVEDGALETQIWSAELGRKVVVPIRKRQFGQVVVAEKLMYAPQLIVEYGDSSVNLVQACLKYKRDYAKQFPSTELWAVRMKHSWVLEVVLIPEFEPEYRKYQKLKDNRGAGREQITEIVCADSRIVEPNLRALSRLVGANVPYTPTLEPHTPGCCLFGVRYEPFEQLFRSVQTRNRSLRLSDDEVEEIHEGRIRARTRAQTEGNKQLVDRLKAEGRELTTLDKALQDGSLKDMLWQSS